MTNGEARGQNRNAALHSLVSSLSTSDALTQYGITSVRCGVLSGEPSVESALRDAEDASQIDEILIYPLFMSEGYFFKTALPNQIEAAALKLPITTLSPLGKDTGLPALIYQKSLKTLAKTDWEFSATRLLIVGHGSTKSPSSGIATCNQVQSLQKISSYACVESCFLEEEPFLTKRLEQTKQQPTIIVGYFTGSGLHGKNDIEQAIEQTQANAMYTGSIGSAPEIKELIIKTIAASV